MKAQLSHPRIGARLITIGLAALGFTTAFGQDAVYAARVSSGSSTIWDAPFYWIDAGVRSPYGTATVQSGVTDPVGTPTRVGSYYHTANSLSLGEGYGLVHVKGTQADAVYQVQVTQPPIQLPTDIVMNVGSTNCDLGGVFGATPAGGWTNTTAFQAEYSSNKWALVCYLTNRTGVTQPHVDFKCLSGGVSTLHHYADCVRFHMVGGGTNLPAPVRISAFSGTTLQYTGGSGTRFVLHNCSGLCDWQPLATNFVTPGSFVIPAVGTEAAAFYAITSE
jgi:hypothetical protein